MFICSITVLLTGCIVPKTPKQESKITNKILHSYQEEYAEIISSPEWTHTGEISRHYDKEQELRFAKIKGFRHQYIFSELGIRITINDPYDEMFVNQDAKNAFIQTQNTIKKQWWKFVLEKFIKNSFSTIEQELATKNKQFSWCILEKYKYQEEDNELLHSLRSYTTYSLLSIDWRACDDFGNNAIYYIMHPNNTQIYYKIARQDWCAPSCGIPSTIEILP
jgi:hypothetical protein